MNLSTCAAILVVLSTCAAELVVPASQASVAASSTVGIMTWNLACRPGKHRKCDNCKSRFLQIAEAIKNDGKDFTDMPDFDSLDVIVAQELFFEDGDPTLKILDDALGSKGFKRVRSPGPTKHDNQCKSPTYPNAFKTFMIDKLNIPNGGLVTYTKLKVVALHAQRWCVNIFPTDHGFTVAHLKKDGANIFAFNSHFAPEYGPAQEVRIYQVSELSNEAKSLAAAFEGLPYISTFGGDSNEDLYGMKNKDGDMSCSGITSDPRTTQFLSSIGLSHLHEDCEKKVFGSGDNRFTWDYKRNGIDAKYHEAYEMLDYLTVMGSSARKQPAQTPMKLHYFQKTKAFAGEFCEDMTTGGGDIQKVEMHVLSDHNAVTANINLPERAQIKSKEDSKDVSSIFASAVDNFDNQAAACGQEGTQCFSHSNCCRNAKYSFDNQPKTCYAKDWKHIHQLVCQSCGHLHETCQWDWECCGQHGLKCSFKGQCFKAPSFPPTKTQLMYLSIAVVVFALVLLIVSKVCGKSAAKTTPQE